MDIKTILSDIEAAHSGHFRRKHGSSHDAITKFRRRNRRAPDKFGEFQSSTTETQTMRENTSSQPIANKVEWANSEYHTIDLVKMKTQSEKNPRMYYGAIVRNAKQKLVNLLRTDIGKQILQQVKKLAHVN